MAKRASSSRVGRPRARQAARPAPSRPASEVAREEVLAGEAANETTASRLVGNTGDVEDVISEHIAAPNEEPTQLDRRRHTEDAAANLVRAVRLLRWFIEQTDDVDRPFIRVVGRIMYILTVDGDQEWCTATPIAAALLLFLGEHLDAEHRQQGTTRQTIDVSDRNLQALLYDRLTKLRSEKWRMARKHPTAYGFQLTENGRFVFDSWPEDINFDPSIRDLWIRKTPGTRGGGRLPSADRQG